MLGLWVFLVLLVGKGICVDGNVDRIVKSWAFTQQQLPRSMMENFDLGILPSVGFVRLVATPASLTIDLVQKPRNWDGRFCSVMLPATVRQLYTNSGFDIQLLENVDVLNLADPRIAGCRCYVALMLAMGMTVINKVSVNSAAEFCNQNERAFIYASPGPDGPRLPATRPGARAVLKSAKILTKFFDGISVFMDANP